MESCHCSASASLTSGHLPECFILHTRINVVRIGTTVNAYKRNSISILFTGMPSVSRSWNLRMPKCTCLSLNSSSSIEAPSCPFKPGPCRCIYKLAPKALEKEPDEGTICLFNRRYEEGYDVTDDAFYTAWAKLKRPTQPRADISNTRGRSHSSNSAPSHTSTSMHSLTPCNSGQLLEDVLKIPEQQTKKTTREL